jgi:hypothetical protein
MKRVVARLLALSFAVSLGGSLAMSRLAIAANDCTIATSGDSETAKACAKGGRAEAKKAMKKMVADAKAKKGKFTCEQCHKDLDNYALTANAKDDFKKMQDLLKS